MHVALRRTSTLVLAAPRRPKPAPAPGIGIATKRGSHQEERWDPWVRTTGGGAWESNPPGTAITAPQTVLKFENRRPKRPN